MEDLKKYIEECVRKSGKTAPSTLEELNAYIAEYMQERNNRSLEEFEGYSSMEISMIIHHPFDEGSPLQLQTLSEDDYEKIPLFRQVKQLLQTVQKESKIKLTQAGNLPVRIVQEIYHLGATDSAVERGITKLRKETDSNSVQLARIAVELMHATKKRNNILTLTKEGEKLVTNNDKLLRLLLNTLFSKYNTAYFDFYSSEDTGRIGTGFVLLMLGKYGDETRSHKFYGDKYFRAFPILREQFQPSYASVEKESLDCFSWRVFDGLFYHLGLITIDEVDKYGEEYKKDICKTGLFDKLIKCLPPKNL